TTGPGSAGPPVVSPDVVSPGVPVVSSAVPVVGKGASSMPSSGSEPPSGAVSSVDAGPPVVGVSVDASPPEESPQACRQRPRSGGAARRTPHFRPSSRAAAETRKNGGGGPARRGRGRVGRHASATVDAARPGGSFGADGCTQSPAGRRHGQE